MTTKPASKPKCKLTGTDRNLFSIIARVSRSLERADQRELAREFREKATAAHSRDEVLRLCFDYVEVS